jgi:hypothetical protein
VLDPVTSPLRQLLLVVFRIAFPPSRIQPLAIPLSILTGLFNELFSMPEFNQVPRSMIAPVLPRFFATRRHRRAYNVLNFKTFGFHLYRFPSKRKRNRKIFVRGCSPVGVAVTRDPPPPLEGPGLVSPLGLALVEPQRYEGQAMM